MSLGRFVADVECCYADAIMSDSNVPQDLRTIMTALRKKRYRATVVYALYLSDRSVLDGIEVDPSGLLYIGMTDDSLEVRSHYGHKDSSFSSPRRSLGAILKHKLALIAIPRGSGQSAKDMGYGNSGDPTGSCGRVITQLRPALSRYHTANFNSLDNMLGNCQE